MKRDDFVQKVLDLATKYETVYLWGTFGAPLTDSLIRQKAAQYPKRYSEKRKEALRALTEKQPWAFDCVGLIKGILWGWNADETRSFGGAVYQSNGVPDRGASAFANACTEKSTDFDTVEIGELVYRSGHVGVYVGDGKVVEATLKGKYDGVVITELSEGNWKGHGKLPYLDYTEPQPSPEPPKVGDVVNFSGGTHYISSNGSIGFKARSGPARVTRYLEGKKHPYHLIRVGKTSNVYGWVDADTVSAL